MTQHGGTEVRFGSGEDISAKCFNDRLMQLKAVCIAVYVILFAIGGSVHLSHIIEDGWLPYTYAPDWINSYWTSLVFFDFIAIGLLLKYRNIGLVFSLLVMISDVGVNTYAHSIHGGDVYWGYIAQVVFLGFILGTAGFLWRPRHSLR